MPKKAECFLTMETTLESPLDCKEIKLVYLKGNQPCILIGRTDVEAEAIIVWPPNRRANSLEKALILGKIEGRRKGRQRTRWLDGITDSIDMSLSKLWEMVKDGELWHTALPGAAKSQTQLSD